MKHLSLALSLAICIASLGGAPLRNVATVIEQPDGSKYACFMTGDEYYHRAHDSKGFTIIKNLETGWSVYAQMQGSNLVPSTLIPGKDDPAAGGLKQQLLPDESILKQRFEVFRGASRNQYGRAPSTGTINNICIFVRFAGETEFNDALQLYTDMHYSSTGASLRGYFLEESNNQLTVNSTFYPTAPGSMVLSWQDSQPRNYYYPQSPSNPIGYAAGPPTDPDMYGFIRLHTMFSAAVTAIAPMVPPGLILDADMPPDNLVDNVTFICRGNADGNSALFWPHSWQMNNYPTVPMSFINGLQTVDYNLQMQVSDPVKGGGIDTALVCHEFSHTLGFPDLYHYTLPWDGINPCGYWDPMDFCFQIPQHHLAYMKWKYGGWFTTVPPLPASGSLTLNAVASNPFACYMYQMPTGEQIWIEYRRAVGNYESRIPNSGLIFYRVDQSLSPWGNAGGPPEEVYVYRPYVSSSPPDGNINWASFAWEMPKAAFNQFTDPKPFSQSMPSFVAPLNIHSIGSNTGPQISFEVGTQIPVIWIGAIDSNWFNPGNWTTGAVPTATDFVIIHQGLLYNNCDIPLTPPGMPAACQTLRNEYQLTLQPGSTLQVGGSLYSIGRMYVNGTLQVRSNLTIAYWYAGSWLHSTVNPGSQLNIGGNCLFEPGTQIQLTTGQLIFSQIGVSPPINTFTCDAINAVLFDLIVNKTGTTLQYNSQVPFPPLMINGALSVNAGSAFIINAAQFINIAGNITVTMPGVLQATHSQSTISLTGPPGLQTVSISSPNSYVQNLDVNNNAAPMLASNIDVRGNFTINQGTFIANNNTILVGGNWIDNMGLSGFQKGTSRVVFCGPANEQYITLGGPSGVLMENFHILELNKASGTLNMNVAGQNVQCDFFDWSSGLLKVTDGIFNALDLTDMCIAGNFSCNAPGMIILTDVNGAADLAANLNIQGGTISVSIGNPYPGSVSTWGIQAGSLNMNGGSLIFQNTGLNVIPGGGTFSTNISGGTILVSGDCGIHNPGFDPSGGLVWIATNANPVAVGCSGGGWFWDLQLWPGTANTTSEVDVRGSLQVESGCSFSVGNNLRVAGSLGIQGQMDVWNPAIVTANSVNVLGSLNLHNGAILECDGDININGSLSCVGNPGDPAQIRGSGRGYWKMHVLGTIGATYTEFSKLREEGIWIMPAGSVDLTACFDNCGFTDGATFITIENSQDLVINSISFTSSSGCNIAKPVNSGTVTVNSSSGSLAGPLYENDPYARVFWVGFDPNIVVQSFTVSDVDPYVADQLSYAVTIKNDSANPVQSPFKIHLFKSRSTPPGWNESGDFIHSCPTLDPSETYTYSFSGIYSMTDEAWTSWLLIDPEGAVQETDETDNRDSESLAWQELPLAENIAITSAGRISWTYPIWATRYEIYDSADPYGSFSYLGSTVNSFFDVSLSADRRFFEVRAERDAPAK